jgi:hypothetical protein
VIYDVAIVGAGPAGMAVAKQLDPKLNAVLLEKGQGVEQRTSITSGFGGAGLFSDGKLVVSDTVGGNIREYTNEPYKYLELAAYMCGIEEAPYTKIYLNDKQQNLTKKASREGVELLATNTYHLGTDGSRVFTEKMFDELDKKCKIRLNTNIHSIEQVDGMFHLHAGEFGVDSETYRAKTVVIAAGREGSKWTEQVLSDMKVKVGGNKVDLGIRMEVPDAVAEELVSFSHDFKMHYYTKCFDDLVRTFCVCPHGEVVREQFNDLTTCNGHSYKEGKTENTNFALLVSIPFGAPIHPNEFGRSIVSLANNIAESGVIVQRLGDLISGRRSTADRVAKSIVKPTLNAFPGDLSLVLPYRYLSDLVEMIQVMDKIAPGMLADGNLAYGVEVKFYSNIIELKEMETSVPNLYCVGDGSGVSRGIIQAVASGIIAADTINKRSK